MVHDLGEANRQWAKLAPSPRWAPLPFRWRWLVHSIWVLLGSCVFGGGCLLSLPFSLNADPVGAWRLAWARREAPGRREKVEGTGIGGDETSTIFRHTYTFRLPDGTTPRGTSYAEATDAPREQAVTVEYDPRDHRINRIRGTRTGFLPPSVHALWLVPLVGLAIIAGAIRHGLLQIRVLERASWPGPPSLVAPCGSVSTGLPVALIPVPIRRRQPRRRSKSCHSRTSAGCGNWWGRGPAA